MFQKGSIPHLQRKFLPSGEGGEEASKGCLGRGVLLIFFIGEGPFLEQPNLCFFLVLQGHQEHIWQKLLKKICVFGRGLFAQAEVIKELNRLLVTKSQKYKCLMSLKDLTTFGRIQFELETEKMELTTDKGCIFSV